QPQACPGVSRLTCCDVPPSKGAAFELSIALGAANEAIACTSWELLLIDAADPVGAAAPKPPNCQCSDNARFTAEIRAFWHFMQTDCKHFQLSQRRIHDLGCFVIRAMDQVAIGIERHLDRGVANAPADCENVHAGCDQHRHVRMPQTLQPHIRYADRGHGATPRLGGVAGGLWLAVPCGEHEAIGGGLAHAECEPLFLLRTPVCPERLYGGGW